MHLPRTVAAASIVSAVMYCTTATAGTVTPTVVYPTGVFPDDVNHVQAAVSAGGTVELSARDRFGHVLAFNFGPSDGTGGAVVIGSDVRVLGHPDSVKPTITGGINVFFVNQPVSVEISGLKFVHPNYAAIGVIASKKVLIANNEIHDVVPATGAGVSYGFGIAVNAVNDQFSDVSGTVSIYGNVIDGVEAQASYGIEVSNLDASVDIGANLVSNVNLNAILVGFLSAEARIHDNVVIPGAASDPNFTSGNAIFVGHPRTGGSFQIYSNYVECVNPDADGIAMIGSAGNPVTAGQVHDNLIDMKGSDFGGVSLYDEVSNIKVQGNEIFGTGAVALQISTAAEYSPATAVGDVLEDNYVARFSPSVADIFLDVNAAKTRICQQQGTLIDNGTGTVRTTVCRP